MHAKQVVFNLTIRGSVMADKSVLVEYGSVRCLGMGRLYGGVLTDDSN